MTVPNLIPDLRILGNVIRLFDAVATARARQPASPGCYCPADDSLEPEPSEITDLRALPDDHQAQVHAVYWLGRERDGDAEQYDRLYQHALRTDLGDGGAAYLAAKANLGDGLRCGLQRLGLVAMTTGPDAGRAQELSLCRRTM
jgi:hypothetical protein